MYKNERRITNMKEEKKIKTKEEWMEELGIDDEGDIVGEEDLEVPVDELFADNDIENNKVEFDNLELPEDITSFRDLKEYIDKLPKDANFNINFSLKRRE
jgi:hypothetical protein